jgi:hypothetical protein
MDQNDPEVVSLNGGEIVIWIENDSSLHIKCVTRSGDPVELNSEEVDELCKILQKLAERTR